MKGGLKYKRLTEAKVIIKPPPIMAIPTGNEIEVEEDEEEEKSKAEDVPVVKVLEEKDEKIISPTKAADSSEPSTSDLQNDDREEMTEEKSQPTVKKPRHRGKGPKQQPKPANYDLTDDPSYAVWMPPESALSSKIFYLNCSLQSFSSFSDQSGDGKTNLNAKFGY